MKRFQLPLKMREDNLLYLLVEERWTEVHIKESFPWSSPGKFLSLRDQEDNEVCFIEDLNEVDLESRNIIQKYLNMVEFVLEIISIIEIQEDFELRCYRVVTKQGPRKFQTKLEDWPEIMRDGTIIIQDLAGDLFRIQSIDYLDRNSQEILSTYVA